MAVPQNVFFKSPDSPTKRVPKLPEPREGWQSRGTRPSRGLHACPVPEDTSGPGAGRPALLLTGTYSASRGPVGGGPTQRLLGVPSGRSCRPLTPLISVSFQGGDGAPDVCPSGLLKDRRPRPTELHTAEAAHRVWSRTTSSSFCVCLTDRKASAQGRMI